MINVAVGAYSISARARDISGAMATSTTVSIFITAAGANAFSPTAQYIENGGYIAGGKVKNVGKQYECKPWPFSGWCNAAAWAYGPGVGASWGDAWLEVGTCSNA